MPATKAAFAALAATMRERIPDPATLPDFGFDPGIPEQDRAGPGIPVVEVLPRAPDRHGERARRGRGAAGGQPLGRPALRRRHADPRHAPPPSRARPLRPLVANFAFRSSWMRPVVARIGGVRASMENALALCKARPARRRVSRGSARRGQAVPRALSPDPFRPRWLRAPGAHGERAHHSGGHRRARRRSIPCWASSPASPQPLGLALHSDHARPFRCSARSGCCRSRPSGRIQIGDAHRRSRRPTAGDEGRETLRDGRAVRSSWIT